MNDNLHPLLSYLNSVRRYTMYYLPIVAGVSFYLLLVRVLRYRRRDEFQRRFPYKTRDEMASMSLSEASVVMRELALQEFPIMFYGSISFALFKVLNASRSP